MQGRCFLLIVEVFLFDPGGVVLELGLAIEPAEEENSFFAVRGDLMGVFGVELDPVLILKFFCVFKL